jgi:hypothetical protein
MNVLICISLTMEFVTKISVKKDISEKLEVTWLISLIFVTQI